MYWFHYFHARMAAANTLWPTEPKVFIIWPFTEKTYIPLIEDKKTDHLIIHFSL